MREKRILLGLVETVNFVDKDDGAMAGAGFLLGHGHDLLDFLDAGENGAEGDELGTRQARNEARESGLAAAGRAPEEHGAKIVIFNLHAKRFAGTEKFFLAHEFIERARAHAFGERLVGSRDFGLWGRWRQF